MYFREKDGSLYRSTSSSDIPCIMRSQGDIIVYTVILEGPFLPSSTILIRVSSPLHMQGDYLQATCITKFIQTLPHQVEHLLLPAYASHWRH